MLEFQGDVVLPKSSTDVFKLEIDNVLSYFEKQIGLLYGAKLTPQVQLMFQELMQSLADIAVPKRLPWTPEHGPMTN